MKMLRAAQDPDLGAFLQHATLLFSPGAFSAHRLWENVNFVLPLGKNTTAAFLSLRARPRIRSFYQAKYLVSSGFLWLIFLLKHDLA